MPATATTTILSVVLNCSTPSTPPPSNSSSSTAADYDAEGAMKFSVAVVLVFGVGVIGMLGIYYKRNVNEELSDKEVDDFVKRFEGKRYNLDKQHRKEVMRQLVESFFARTLAMQSQDNRQLKTTVRFSLRPTLSEPDLLHCTSLLTEGHNANDRCVHTTNSQQQQQQQLTSHQNLCGAERLLLSDPAPPEARSISRSFHVPGAGNFIGRSRKNAVERAKLSIQKAQLKNRAESEMPLLGPAREEAHLGNGQRTPSTLLLPTGQRRAGNNTNSNNTNSSSNNVVTEETESSGRGFSVHMGGSLVLPTILVNDVQV